jgi:hypothetical protein
MRVLEERLPESPLLKELSSELEGIARGHMSEAALAAAR